MFLIVEDILQEAVVWATCGRVPQMSTSHQIRTKHRFTISLLPENNSPCCDLRSCCTVVVDFYALTFLLILALSVCSQLLVPADIPTDTWLLFLTSPRLHMYCWGECAEYSPCSGSSPPPAGRSSVCRINCAHPWNLVLGKAVCVQQGWHRGVTCKGSRVSTAGRSMPHQTLPGLHSKSISFSVDDLNSLWFPLRGHHVLSVNLHWGITMWFLLTSSKKEIQSKPEQLTIFFHAASWSGQTWLESCILSSHHILSFLSPLKYLQTGEWHLRSHFREWAVTSFEAKQVRGAAWSVRIKPSKKKKKSR